MAALSFHAFAAMKSAAVAIRPRGQNNMQAKRQLSTRKSTVGPTTPSIHSNGNSNSLERRMICHAASTSTATEVAEIIEGTGSPSPTESRVTFSRATLGDRLTAAAATASALGFCVMVDDVPALRLGLLTYMLWAGGEWVVHKYFMHAKSGSWADRVTHLNTLHVTHHIQTKKDMTMESGFEVDALYFHFPNSVVQIAFATAVGLAADSVLSLDIPSSWIPVAAVLGMAIHNTLWNTLHMGMHEIPGEYDDGMPCAPLVYKFDPLKAYRQWVYDNHTTHHDVGGGANYNIVCPGADLLLGTYMQRSRSVKCD